MAVSLEYNLTGRGWSECIVEIDDQRLVLTASYLSNALADLLRATADLLKGNNETTASFIEEPGEYRWRFTRVSEDRLSVCILWFDEFYQNRPNLEGKVILKTECRLRTFAGSVLSASQRVLKTHGLDGYKEQWVHYEFPTTLQVNLKKALG